ncbi:hypothetical protein JOC48_001137 [Aquibacillus albus]|uniref:Uncharacterized protein n=1 Tax=Aquibacillus albus TaxID=1168171 RepID=A0ABS2MXT2_9BACI|nr:hypothetical protein [Aquibacillus albus]
MVMSQYALQLNIEGYTTKMNKPFTKVQVKRILDRKDTFNLRVKVMLSYYHLLK